MRSIRCLLLFSVAAYCGSAVSVAAPQAPARQNEISARPRIAWSLNRDWNLVTDPSGSLKVSDLASVEKVRRALVPGSWQSEFDDLRDYAGVAWYWTSFTLGPLAQWQIALVRFGAVDYRAEVYVNGQKAGSHEGGYLPFEFDVTSLLHPG